MDFFVIQNLQVVIYFRGVFTQGNNINNLESNKDVKILNNEEQ